MYLSYDEYMEMGGSADFTAFSRLEYRTRKIIDRATQKRVTVMTSVPEAVKRSMVEIINSMVNMDPTEALTKPVLTGFSNDGYSESYAKPVAADSLETAYYGIVRDYLSTETDDHGTPLLYAGVDA